MLGIVQAPISSLLAFPGEKISEILECCCCCVIVVLFSLEYLMIPALIDTKDGARVPPRPTSCSGYETCLQLLSPGENKAEDLEEDFGDLLIQPEKSCGVST